MARRSTLVLTATAALLAVACGSTEQPQADASASSTSDSAPASESATESATAVTDRGKPYTGYPDAIVALGHSGSTGESSDPEQPGIEVRENSWVTGTNPEVDSLYLRILDKNPAIKGQAYSLSQASATIDMVLGQAQEAVTEHPHNALVVIQVIDADIVCPASDRDLEDFQKSFEAVLSKLAAGLPSSRVLAVTQMGSPETYAEALTRSERRTLGGTGPCAFLDPKGEIVPRELDRLEGIIQGYEAAVERGCAAYPRCVFDDYAFSKVIDRREYLTEDLNHFSIAGHANAAEVAWGAMQGTVLTR